MNKESSYKTEAIILRSYDIREYDRMYTIFSRERGKLCVLGIGTRKPTAKLASGLEPLTKSEIFLVKGRTFDRVKGVIIDIQYPMLRKNFDLLSSAKQTSRILEQLAPDGESNEEIFEALSKYLAALEGAGSGQANVQAHADEAKLMQLGLLWKIAKWSGQEPNLFHCANCNSKLARQEAYVLTFPSGVLCNNCRANQADSSAKVDQDTIKLLRIFLFKEYGLLEKVKVSTSALRQTERATKLMLQQLLGRRMVL